MFSFLTRFTITDISSSYFYILFCYFQKNIVKSNCNFLLWIRSYLRARDKFRDLATTERDDVVKPKVVELSLILYYCSVVCTICIIWILIRLLSASGSEFRTGSRLFKISIKYRLLCIFVVIKHYSKIRNQVAFFAYLC